MTKHPGAPVLLAVFLLLTGSRDSLARKQATAPVKDPAIAEGAKLHDQGKYAEALQKFGEALSRDPKNVEALYESAFSSYANKDLMGALGFVERALSLESNLRGALFNLKGNVLDDLGNFDEAIKAYEAGAEESPETPLLQYNLGIAYLHRGAWAEARGPLERDVALNPGHASGHLALSQVFEKGSRRAPALLAAVRFLLLEPSSKRSRDCTERIDALFGSGVSRDEKGDVTLTVNSDAPKGEGDFAAGEIGILMTEAASGIDDGKKLEEPEASIQKLVSALTIIAETTKPKSGFAAEYYVPYYRSLAKGELDAAVHWAWQSRDPEKVGAWLEANKDRVARFKEWSAAYKWPTPKSRD